MSSYDQFFKQAKKASVGSKKPVKTASAQQLAAALKEQVKPKIQNKRAKSRKISWKLAGTSFLGFLIAGTGLHYADQIDSLLHKIEFQVIGSAVAQTPSAPAATEPAKSASTDAGAAQTPAAAAPTPAGPKTSYTEEEINHLSKLNERKRELDAREEELARLEKEVNQQREALEKRISELEKTRREIASILDDRVQADEQKVETLVQVYSSMKPQQAATIIQDMDEALAVDVLGRMKKKNAAEIMNFFKPEKARVLSEKYAGYRKK